VDLNEEDRFGCLSPREIAKEFFPLRYGWGCGAKLRWKCAGHLGRDDGSASLYSKTVPP
jgi:hypothetical protein